MHDSGIPRFVIVQVHVDLVDPRDPSTGSATRGAHVCRRRLPSALSHDMDGVCFLEVGAFELIEQFVELKKYSMSTS